MSNMYQPNTSVLSPTKPLLIGVCINLFIMVLFISGVNNPNPEWGAYWFIKPILVVGIAGLFNGILFNLLATLRKQGGGKLIASIFISLIGFVFILWISSVLGLNGTLWN